MTFKTKYKIGDMVVIDGMTRMIEEVHIDVGVTFKKTLYRYLSNDGTVMREISEDALLLENPLH